MHIMPFKAILPKLEKIDNPDDFFSAVKFDYPHLDKTHFKARNEAAVYIYQITGENYQRTGLITCTDLSGENSRSIIPHENTLPVKEEKLRALGLERQAMIKPVLLVHPDCNDLWDVLKDYISNHAPVLSIDFKVDSETHSLWELDMAQSRSIQELFNAKITRAYIADGHHRFKVASQLRTFDPYSSELVHNRVLSIYFPFSDVDVLSFDRIVDFKGIMEQGNFINALYEYFDVQILEMPARPKHKDQIILLCGASCYDLTLKTQMDKISGNVLRNTERIQHLVFERILGISDILNNERIRYEPGTDDPKRYKKETQENGSLAVFMFFPMELENIIAIADQSETLPPKSSWFKPRVKNAICSLKIFP